MSGDTIANMLSQIKNATMAGHESVELPHSKVREEILKVLEEAGFVKEVKVFKESGMPYKSLHIEFVYEDGRSMIRDVRRISQPGRRAYSPSSEIKMTNPKYGVVVVSTSAGIMSGEDARKKKLGGEIICEVR